MNAHERRFNHIGLVTDQPQPGEVFVEQTKVWVTRPNDHPQRIEYLRFKKKPELEPGSPQWKLWNMPHIAYRVNDLEKVIERAELVYGPFEPADFGRVVFIHQYGAIVEYLEYTDLATWFGAPTPWTSA